MGWFTAAHPGVCIACGGDIVPGQPIEKRDNGYAHAVHDDTRTEENS